MLKGRGEVSSKKHSPRSGQWQHHGNGKAQNDNTMAAAWQQHGTERQQHGNSMTTHYDTNGLVNWTSHVQHGTDACSVIVSRPRKHELFGVVVRCVGDA
eukprot:m.83900 g.83900  ORF g.83900 m.83900 type:complete len:99 (+) comp14778_c0_seq6:304-600(+)